MIGGIVVFTHGIGGLLSDAADEARGFEHAGVERREAEDAGVGPLENVEVGVNECIGG